MDEEEKHREFLLSVLRGAMLRAKALAIDLESIGIALRGDLISAETAVAWIRNDNLMWIVGALPEDVGRLSKPMERQDENPA